MYKKKYTIYTCFGSIQFQAPTGSLRTYCPQIRSTIQVLDLYNPGQLGKQYLVFVFSPFLPYFHLFSIKHWHISFLSHFYRKFKPACMWNTLKQGTQVAKVRFLKSLYICKIITYHSYHFLKIIPTITLY